MPRDTPLPPRVAGSLTDPIYVHGFSAVKWPLLRQLFPGRALKRWTAPEPLSCDSTVVLWGATPVPPTVSAGRVVRIEDGFLRSVGLGVDLTWPISWTVDTTGLHFDASSPSDLESILASAEWCGTAIARAARLRARIVSSGITKYNVSGHPWQAPRTRRPVHLVVGQVPTDAAVQLAGQGVAFNCTLLERIRSEHPDAYILYKVHPDIVAGMRRNDDAHAMLAASCDEILTGADLNSVFAQVDRVHVATSLTGFEALLRGCQVHCYGRPFYAGWGLTVDHVEHSDRRRRRLTLDELVHGALIDYPVYFARGFSGLITPEAAVDRLAAERVRRRAAAPIARQVLRAALRRVVGVR